LFTLPQTFDFEITSNRALSATFRPNDLEISEAEIYGTHDAGELLNFIAFASGGIHPLEWSFEISSGGTTLFYDESSTLNFFEWTPTQGGVYSLRVICTDYTGKSVDCITPFAINVDGLFSVIVNSSGAENVIGNGIFVPGEIVNIFAGIRPGYSFAEWSAMQMVSFHSPHIAYTSFIMPDSNVIVTANWEAVVVKPGDVNGDGVIDEADVELLIRFLLASDKVAFRAANPAFIYENADVNNDGIVNTADLTLLRFLIQSS
jgi:hypothetical protein